MPVKQSICDSPGIQRDRSLIEASLTEPSQKAMFLASTPPHGVKVDVQGGQAMVCKRAPGKTARHHALNDVIWRAMTSADIPASKELSGLTRRDGKRHDPVSRWPSKQPTVNCQNTLSLLLTISWSQLRSKTLVPGDWLLALPIANCGLRLGMYI